MNRTAELAERIKARAQERKEKEKCAKYELKLEGSAGILTGKTKSGKSVVFEQCYGFSYQSQYGAGTLKVNEGENWITIFAKGYPSKALEYMNKN
jgi:hypothetical protein